MNVSINNNNPSSSPVTTPGSCVDENKFLVPYQINSKFKKKWLKWTNIPIGIIIVSFIQFLIHTFSTNSFQRLFRFEPEKRTEIWRFFTYMLLHDDWCHLLLNIIIQCIFAIILERRQGKLRIISLYLFGGATGVLGASCFRPDFVIGASAGVYALLISNISDLILNYSCVSNKIYRFIFVGVLVIFDIIYNVIHIYTKKEPIISWEAHIVGGITGLLLGFIIYKQINKSKPKFILLNNTIFWISIVIYILILLCFVILIIQIKKCTPTNEFKIRFKYVYFC